MTQLAPKPPALDTSPTSYPAATTATRASASGRRLRHTIVLARRNVVKTLRTPEQMVDVTGQPIVFLLLFVYVFGGAIGHGSSQDYLEFVLPGIMAQGLVMASIAIGQNLNADIEKGVFDRLRSLPIARSAPLTGAVLADLMRYVIACVIFLAFGSLLGYRVHTNLLLGLAAVALAVGFSMCFCWISVYIGMKARTPAAVQGTMMLLILPLAFESSAYVPVSTMPGWMQAFVKLNPITHLVDTVRALMQGGAIVSPMLWTLGWMAVLLGVFMPLAVRAYNKRM